MPIDSTFLDKVCTTRAIGSLNLNTKQHLNKDCQKLKFIDDLLYFKECMYTLEGFMSLGFSNPF